MRVGRDTGFVSRLPFWGGGGAVSTFRGLGVDLVWAFFS